MGACTVTQDQKPLAVHEIACLNLKNCGMAVLSACESGVFDSATNNYENFVGLSTALIVAGVPRVLSSLWRVNDLATGLLINFFYSQLKHHSGLLLP